MKFNYLTGFLANTSLDFMAWVFLGIIIMVVFIGISVFIFVQKTTVLKKTAYILSFLLICILGGGISGLIVSALTYLIAFAIVRDFIKLSSNTKVP